MTVTNKLKKDILCLVHDGKEVNRRGYSFFTTSSNRDMTLLQERRFTSTMSASSSTSAASSVNLSNAFRCLGHSSPMLMRYGFSGTQFCSRWVTAISLPHGAGFHGIQCHKIHKTLFLSKSITLLTTPFSGYLCHSHL